MPKCASTCFGSSESTVSTWDRYSLTLGDGRLHPVQWVTHNFLHLDFFHVLGNMIFLWAFGIVVEGKLGPWKYLLTYLLIGITQRSRWRPRFRSRLHRLIEEIGRWSMLDIYVVTLLAALVQLRGLASVEVEQGAMAFAVVVMAAPCRRLRAA